MSHDAPISLKTVSGLGNAAPSSVTTPSTNSNKQQPLPVINLDPQTYGRALDCVHCGLCLPACPTYTANGLEADSPRGRIYLMKGLADARIAPTPAVVEHLDLCLDCRACETACPSGVVYHELIEETRAQLSTARTKTLADRVTDFMFYHVFTHPWRVKLAMLPARLIQRIGLWHVVRAAARRTLPPHSKK